MARHVLLKAQHQTFPIENGETVLAAALRAGHILPYSCRGGTCGSCLGRVLSGRVAYEHGRPPALSAREEAEGKALFCQAEALEDLIIEARVIDAARDIPIRTLPCRVLSLERLAHDVMRLRLQLPSTERLQFLAGQYIDILLPGGRRRSFSLANPPHADDYLELHIRYVPGGLFSGQVFGGMQEKTMLRFQGPLGTFFLREDSDRPIVMMAGGTGFAPLKAMLEHAFQQGLQRPAHLYWGARARRDLYLDGLVQDWAMRYPHFHYTPVLSEPRDDDAWPGRTGFVHAAVAADYPDLRGVDLYMSGPPAMIEAAKAAFAARGLPEAQLFYDSFEYAMDNQTGSSLA
ncbi:MAG: CDP-6-deoxy-delta-3,4-glucoseen reductase [Gammaproteobacteria bacterium]